MKLVGARYGLRGVRVGEASLPGPPNEFDMTLVDSSDDGEPIGHASEGGHVQQMDTAIDSCSDTESVAEPRRRRLRLVWNPSVQVLGHREVRAADNLIRYLARRVGPLSAGSSLPRALRQQRWSPLNVPLMWSAAGSEESGVVVEWLITSCEEITEPVELHGGQVTCGEAVQVGWTALREVFRSWNVHATGDLTIWLRSNGFAAVQPGNHISARAQEHILTQACACDARVALLESAYVALTLHCGRQMCVIPPPVEPPRQERPQPHHESWAGLTTSIWGISLRTEFPC